MLKWIARLRRPDSNTTGFLGRLRRDIRGNTLAIVGAALVPITAMIFCHSSLWTLIDRPA